MGKLVRRLEKTLSHATSAGDAQLGLKATAAVHPCAALDKGFKSGPPIPARPPPRKERVPLELIVYSRGSGVGKGSLKPGAGAGAGAGAGYSNSPHKPSPAHTHKAPNRGPQANGHKSSATVAACGSGSRKSVSLSSLQCPRSASGPSSRFGVVGKPGVRELPPRLVPVRTPGEALLAAAERVVPGGRAQLALGTATWGCKSGGNNMNSGVVGVGGGPSLSHAKGAQGGGKRGMVAGGVVGYNCVKPRNGVQGYPPAAAAAAGGAGACGESDGSVESDASLVSSSGLPAVARRQHTRTYRHAYAHGQQSEKGFGNQVLLLLLGGCCGCKCRVGGGK